ncbi:hypothetical protein Aspvir_002292 [Aspergillus viridinutans]|uniref:Uncharacterized protein n=1 Tax=Aspergillus viridinutans TaxID=75553 RepID=A0A9P3F5N8_ASPVI|nr:uncharacterized protein Aspvir_002292 [Aspergillus viridinutans]GIK06642.1 hypothetical protein Aspvir_002292 [Aspergillus viridinutans]
MSSQSKPSIPNIFEDSERVINVLNWESHITQHPGTYKNCFVRRFTHVKNLESSVLHEYLNVIVEDEATDTWTRLIVERQTDQDQVIVGRWSATKGYHENWKPEDCFYRSHAVAIGSSGSSSGNSSGPAGDLPLPLATRSFQKGKFGVKELARLLRKTHELHPRYSLAWYNCYWYSYKVFEGVRAISHLSFDDHFWDYFSWRGKPWRIIFGVTKAVKLAARTFKILRRHQPVHGGPPDPRDLEFDITDIASSAEDYDKSLREIIDILNKNIPKESNADTPEANAAIQEFVNETKEQSNWESYRDIGKHIAYSTGWKPMSDLPIKPILENQDELLEAPTDEESVALDESLFVFLGQLHEANLDAE